MTDDERDEPQADDASEPFNAEELVDLATNRIDPATAFKIGERIFHHALGTGTEVVFTDGETAQTVVVPTDQMPGATEADVKRAAIQHRNDVTALAERFTTEQIANAVTDLEEAGIFRALVDIAAGIIRDSAVVTVTHDPDADEPSIPNDLPDDLTDDERRRIAERATVRLHEESAGVLAGVFLFGEGAPAFKHNFARDLMAESWAWALADAREIADELEAESGEVMPPEAFTDLHHHTYQEGSYWTRALLTRTQETARAMVAQVARALEETPELTRKLTQEALQDIRGGNDHGRIASTHTPPPVMAPGFRDGWGLVPNDPIHRGAVEMMQNAADGGQRWQTAPDRRPFFAVSGTGSWAATFFVSSEGDYATPEAAWALVQQLDDDTADTLDIALCQWLANRNRDPSGLVYITASDILEQKGRAKHAHGGYRPEDKLAAAQHMQALAVLEVEGRNFERYEPVKGKGRRKKVTVAPVGKLLEISVREDLKHLDGTRGPAIGWYYRVGAWSAAFQHDPEATPILARMSQKVIAYDSYQAKHAKRLGRYLAWQFRVRASERSYTQPWTVGSLLASAGVVLPDSNPARFRERIETALTMLLDDGVIGSWKYVDVSTLPARNWLPLWLDWRITVMPPEDLIVLYAKIGNRRHIAAGKTAS